LKRSRAALPCNFASIVSRGPASDDEHAKAKGGKGEEETMTPKGGSEYGTIPAFGMERIRFGRAEEAARLRVLQSAQIHPREVCLTKRKQGRRWEGKGAGIMKNAAFVLFLPTRRSSSSVVSFDKSISKRPLAGLRGLLGDDEYLQRA